MSDNQQFCLRWNNHQSTLVQVIDSLLSSGVLVDCTLAAEGQYLHAHKVVLCACSPYLETLLSQHYEKHPIVILKDVKFQELKSMMDYMYKGEVNISQDQLGQFLKAAESLQIKGLTDGGGGENDSKDVGSTSHKRHDPPPIRKSVPPNTSRSSVVLPSHGTGLTIEPSKRSLPSHLSESQPDSPIRSREGSSSPTPRKRRRPRRPSQGDDDGHQDNCDLPMQQQSLLNTVPIIPQLPAGSSSTITKAPPPDDEPDQPAESDVRLAESGLLKEKIEPQSELLIEPKTEYMEETNNDDSVEDLTLDDDDEYDNMDAAGPSHGGDNSNQSYGQWQMGDRTHDEVFMAAQEAVGGGPRDSQDSAARITITRDQELRLQKLYLEKPAGQRKFTDQEIRRNASRLKIPAVKIRYWMGKRNALAEEPILPPPTAAPSAQLVDVDKPRCKLFADLSFDKKVIMLRKTRTATKFSVRLTNELSRELEIPESRVHSWLRYKVYRNLHMKKSLTAQEIAALNEKFVEFDYLDDDTALLLADRFNVNTSVIKKAFQQRKPVQSQIVKPVIEVKKLNLPASVTITMVPKVTPDTSTPKESKKKMILSRFKTADQKNALFEAFRRSPTVTRADTVAELVEATGLTAIQVTKWFSVFRAKWSQSNESSLKKVLTRGLSSSQLAALEKSYRENRFLTNAQLIELPKNVGLSLRALQAWFSNRRVYEIRSNDKDLVNVGPKSATTSQNLNQIKIMKPVITIPQSDVQQQLSKPDVDLSADEFFESLSKEQKLHLKSACKNFSVSYKRLSRALGLPLDKVQHFIRSYRLKHNIFRFDNLKLPERVHKALLNHYLKYGKISTKTSVILGKRLKVRPEQIMNWNNYHTKRVLQVGGSVNRPAAIPAAEPVFVESIEDPVKVEAVESGEEDETRPSAQVPDPVRKTFSKKEFGGRGRRYFASASAKAILFEEFKKSPTAASTNIKKIAKLVKLTPMQVRKWLYNYGKTLGEQTISKVEACLSHPEIGDEARARLETEFRNCRYMEESDMENLAQQFGLTKRQVGSWFINARYYEALAGKCPGDDDSTVHVPTPAKPDTVSRLSGDSASSSTSRIRRRSLPEESTPSTQLDLLNLTIKQMEILVTEFEANPNLSDERAANMAKRVKITKDRIKAWFKNRRQELQLDSEPTKQKVPPIKIIMPKYTNSNDEMPTIAATDADSKKVPVQQNILFEEFKQSSKLTSERLVKITAETNLSGKQISAWFNWLNYKLSTIPKESLSEENRNKYLSLQQIEELEKYYTENRYANKAARESLSISLDVPKNIIKSWFASRRYYEILSEKGAIEDPISVSEDTDFAEFDASQSETVIDYDWENDPAAIDPLEQNDNEPVEIDPLLNSYCIEESVEQADVDVNIQIPENEIIEDLSSLPYVPRDRLVTPLGDNLEPLEENVERLFWFANKTPNTIKEKYNQEIDEAKTAILDSEFGKYPWPDLDRISQLSAQLLVSEPKIHWWFIKKRCFLTKTILTLPVAPPPKPKPESKNLLIDLTDDDQPEKPGEFEFVTLDDTTQIKREEEPSNENDTLTNGDPFDNNAIKTSNNNEEPPQDSNESNDNAATTPNSSASSSAKKKKVKIPLTSHQRAILLQEYKRNKFISSTQARIVAQDLGLTVTRIENWFESMRKSAARKKANLVEGSVSVKSLSPELESSLEAEYVKSANLSAKRAKMIALKLKTKKKTVKKWFTERAKRKEE